MGKKKDKSEKSTEVSKKMKKEEKLLQKKAKAEKKLMKKLKKEWRQMKKAKKDGNSSPEIGPQPQDDFHLAEMSKRMAPMTKEEWDKQHSKIRRIIDVQTGRSRLIRGEGEILEEPVSYERHRQICKMATQMDGKAFQATLGLPQ